MKIDIGEVLSRAVQITWKHKILWLFNALPMLVYFLIMPLVFLPLLFLGDDLSRISTPPENSLFIVFTIGMGILIAILSMIMLTVGTSSVLFGVVSAEGGMERLRFIDLLKGGKNYWLRILGVSLTLGLGVSIVFFVIFGCATLMGAVTMGLGFICLQPLMLLMYPVIMVVYGFIEESQSAVVVDDMGVAEAIKHGWELIRSNFWRILLISLIVYFGISILSSFVMMPLMTPFFILPFFIEQQKENSSQIIIIFMVVFSLIFFPVMAFVQGVGITFMKSTFTLAYMRLTKPQDNEPVASIEANA